MVNQNFHTVVFQPIRSTPYNYFPQGNTIVRPRSIRTQISGKVNEYVARALAYIQYIIRMIESSTPFFDKYGPVLQEVPKMYHLVKAFNEIKDGGSRDQNSDLTNGDETTYDGSQPRLFI